MLRRLVLSAAALLLVAGIAFTGQKNAGKSGTWSGIVTDNMCAAKGAKPDHAMCASKCVKEHGAKYALYSTEDKKLYILDPQDKIADHAGHEVTVAGNLDGDTIHVTSITMKKGS